MVDPAEDAARRGWWRLGTWGLAALVFLAPVAGSRLSAEMNWGAEDFIALGVMLVAACLAAELIARFARRPLHRAVGALAVVAAFLLVWAQLAVGIL